MEEKNRILCVADVLFGQNKKRINFRWYISSLLSTAVQKSRPIIDVIYVLFITIWEGHLYKEIPCRSSLL